MALRFGKQIALAAVLGSLAIGQKARASEMLEPGVIGTPNSVAATASGPRYALHLHHLHTGENLDVIYRVGNVYLPDALHKLNLFLRDHRTQAASSYDPSEFDLLHAVMTRLGRPDGLIDIVCGYRTPESNHYLRTRSASTGVAEHSQHMLAKAIDIRVPGVQTSVLRDAALSIGAGGVGYYPVSQFVHVDVGPVREWQYGGFTRRLHARTLRARGRAHHSVHFTRGM